MTTFVNSSPSGGVVNIGVFTLAPGASKTVYVTVNVSARTPYGFALVNFVSARTTAQGNMDLATSTLTVHVSTSNRHWGPPPSPP